MELQDNNINRLSNAKTILHHALRYRIYNLRMNGEELDALLNMLTEQVCQTITQTNPSEEDQSHLNQMMGQIKEICDILKELILQIETYHENRMNHSLYRELRVIINMTNEKLKTNIQINLYE